MVADGAGRDASQPEVESEGMEDGLPPLPVGWSRKREWLDLVYWRGSAASWCGLGALKEYAVAMDCAGVHDLVEKELIWKALAHAAAMDAMMRLAKVEMRLVPVVPLASGGGGIEPKVALAAPVGSEVGGGAKKRRAASAGDDSGGVVRRAKKDSCCARQLTAVCWQRGNGRWQRGGRFCCGCRSSGVIGVA